MSADDRIDGPDNDLYDETPPRSIFSATWFRALLVLIVLAVVGAVAVPYILDAMNPPTKGSLASKVTSPRPPTPAPETAATSPSSSGTTTDKMPDKAVVPERAAADKPAPSAITPRKPLAGDTTALADKTMPPDRSTVTDKPAPSDRSTVPDKDTTVRSAAPEPKAEAKPRATPTGRVVASTSGTASTPRGAAAGDWWVQVGAFRDESTARKLAARLRDQNYPVAEAARADKTAPAASAPNPTAVDQYDVLVSGLSVAELNTRLAAKSLTAEPSGTGAVIKPSLPLRDAVALSKDLAVEGLKVQVRRAAATSDSTPRAASDRRPAPAASAGDTLYRVRVGAFPDRATAVTTLKELEAKGYKPFIARSTP